MAISKARSKRKVSGGRYRSYRKKRKFELASLPVLTKIGAKKLKKVRGIGGNLKFKLLQIENVNIYDPKNKKHFKISIKSVLENPANRNFIRRNIMTKGAIIETEKGKAKITSRPGQESTLNAVLV